MFETAVGEINGVLGLTVGGVSVAALITSLICLIKSIINLKRENRLTRQFIEEAFQKAVLPNTVKLDLSSKIEQPLKDGFESMRRVMEETLKHLDKGEKLILSILSQFSHVSKLPEETQAEIQAYLQESKSVTMKLE